MSKIKKICIGIVAIAIMGASISAFASFPPYDPCIVGGKKVCQYQGN